MAHPAGAVRPGRAARPAGPHRHVRLRRRPGRRPGGHRAVPRRSRRRSPSGHADAVPGHLPVHRGRPRRPARGVDPVAVPRHARATTAIDAILDAWRHRARRSAMIQIRVLGGAMARVPAGATAFAHRDGAGHGRDHHALRGPADGRRPSRLDRGASSRRSRRARRRLLQLPRGRGRGADPRGLSRPDVPAAGRRSSAATTRRTCSASTRTSARPPGPDPGDRLAPASSSRVPAHPLVRGERRGLFGLQRPAERDRSTRPSRRWQRRRRRRRRGTVA